MAKTTKEDIIETMVKKTNCSKKCAGDCLNAILDTIEQSLKQDKDVVLTGFGTFSISKRKAREGRNPKTGEKIKISARKVPKFKGGKALKEAVR